MQRLKFNEKHYKTIKSKRLAFSVFAVIFVASKGLKSFSDVQRKILPVWVDVHGFVDHFQVVL